MDSIRVRYFGILAGHAGKRADDVAVQDGTTLGQLLDHLVEIKPESFRAAIFDQKGLNPLVRVIHNQRSVESAGLDAALADGDEILLFPVVSGGS